MFKHNRDSRHEMYRMYPTKLEKGGNSSVQELATAAELQISLLIMSNDILNVFASIMSQSRSSCSPLPQKLHEEQHRGGDVKVEKIHSRANQTKKPDQHIAMENESDNIYTDSEEEQCNSPLD